MSGGASSSLIKALLIDLPGLLHGPTSHHHKLVTRAAAMAVEGGRRRWPLSWEEEVEMRVRMEAGLGPTAPPPPATGLPGEQVRGQA